MPALKLDHLEKFVSRPAQRVAPAAPVVRLPARQEPKQHRTRQQERKQDLPRPGDQRRMAQAARQAAQQARWERAALLYETRPDLSLPSIARIVGYRNHTTLLYILRRTGVHNPAAREEAKREARRKFVEAERARIAAWKEERARRAEEKENQAALKLARRLQALAERHAAAAQRRAQRHAAADRRSALGTGWNVSLTRIERAQRIKDLIRQGLSNAEVAERVGVTSGHVQNIRRGWRWAGLS